MAALVPSAGRVILAGRSFGCAARSSSNRRAVWRRQKRGLPTSALSASLLSLLMLGDCGLGMSLCTSRQTRPWSLAVVKAVLLLQVAGYRRVVLDDFAIKIGDVNATVWTHGKVDWMKPNVSRCDKLRLRFARCSPNVEKDAVTLQFGTMNKVLCRGTGEDLSAQAGQGGVDINERRTGGGEVAVRDRLGSAVAVPIIFAETWVVGALGTPRVRFADGERRIVIRTVTA